MNFFKKINLYRKMNLMQRIILAFVTVSIIAALVGGVGVRNINEIARNDEQLYYNATLPLKTTSEMSKQIEKAQINVLEMIAQNDTTIIKSKLAEINEIATQLNELQEEFQNTIQSPETQQAYDKYLLARSENSGHITQFASLCMQNKDEEALAMFNGEMAITFKALQDSMDELASLKVSDAEIKYNSNVSIASNTSFKMIIYVVFALLFSIIMGYFVARLIGRPIKQLLNAAKSISNNNLDIDLNINSTSEIGLLAEAFDEMADNLNSTISVINTASEQVASGSKQVADSSITLSQGATEQASSIEQLSASINEITQKNTQTATKRGRAKDISTTAMANAEEGFYQMQEMTNAMNDINNSSNNISKIIKVIDDIAFQTNILALNAAVEAARAGQHGKGFAVVAEEVRNLASRSAEAAKETTGMIDNLNEKVQYGNTIADITSKSLNMIVETFAENGEIIENISAATKKQTISINEIKNAIDQISGVVQANSATSEQTASASEELSSQAEMLKNEISKFVLKNNNANYKEIEELNPDLLKLLDT